MMMKLFDEEFSIAITTFTNRDPDNSLSMVDVNLSTTSKNGIDELIKYSMIYLIPNPIDGELSIIPPRIVNREHEEYISLLERLLYDNSSPRPPEDFHANPNTIIESLTLIFLSPLRIVTLFGEIDIFPGLDDSIITTGIESDDYDSGMVDDNSTSLPSSNHFMLIISDSRKLTIDVVKDIHVYY
ncbi:hypothetical protein Tco_1195972 [Tanacetum coccineum]